MRKSIDVLIVGAGWSGMYALIRARRAGLEVAVIEAGSDVGGTWYWNRYPGLRCDIESIHYSYSFDDELQQEWDWSERYATQPEILDYARHVADRFDLRRDILFDTRVERMTWDDSAARWDVDCSGDRQFAARWCIMATGAVSTPKPLDIPGAGEFSGELLTTTDWPHVEPSFAGKRVAVIGTGSSGIQVATELAKQAAHLYVLQRTASYSLLAHNRILTPEEVTPVRAQYQAIREAAKHSMDGLSLPATGRSALEVSDADRSRAYQDIYDSGVPFRFLGVFTDILTDENANRTAHDFVAGTIRARVTDPVTAEKLIPDGYPLGTRRLCLDTGYYEIFNQDNVTLVSLLENPLEAITVSGIRVGAKAIDVDAIVLATGYDAFTGTLGRIDIIGVDGQRLADSWSHGAHAYLGALVHGFPNLFLVTGPQSPSVLSNMIVSIEQHVDWISDLIVDSTAKNLIRVEVEEAAERDWVEGAATIADATVHRFSTSWYAGGNVDGKARVTLPWLGGVGPFRDICDEIAATGYPTLSRQAASVVAARTSPAASAPDGPPPERAHHHRSGVRPRLSTG